MIIYIHCIKFGMATENEIRLDKWLWAVRIFKTRAIARDACNAGKVKMNGISLKPSKKIILNDKITVQKKIIKYEYIVKGLIQKRISAKEADKNVINITPKEELMKLKISKNIKLNHRSKGQGRPTKKERRMIDKEKWRTL